jgi:hypothetical protein
MWMETIESVETSVEAYNTEKTIATSVLSSELMRLGCGFRNCGFLGLIFAPRSTGGFNFEHGLLHYWDLGINTYLNWDRVHERLASLPNNAGHEKVRSSLLEIGLE